MLQANQSYCLLHQQGYVSAYSHSRRMPLWSSFTILTPVSVPSSSSTTSLEVLDLPPGLSLWVLLVPAGPSGPAAPPPSGLSQA